MKNPTDLAKLLEGTHLVSIPTVNPEKLSVTVSYVDKNGYTVTKSQSPDGRITSKTETKEFKWPK